MRVATLQELTDVRGLPDAEYRPAATPNYQLSTNNYQLSHDIPTVLA